MKNIMVLVGISNGTDACKVSTNSFGELVVGEQWWYYISERVLEGTKRTCMRRVKARVLKIKEV